jgi:hypothetical protein
MKISIFLIFTIFGVVSKWAEKALEDGKITITEVVGLAEDLAQILGVPLHIDMPQPEKESTENSDEVIAQVEASPHKTEA